MPAKKTTFESRFNHAFFHALKEEVTDDEVAAVDEAARTLMEQSESTRLLHYGYPAEERKQQERYDETRIHFLI